MDVITNGTILFNCYNSTTNLCVQAKVSVKNFRAEDALIQLQLNFSVNLLQIDKIFSNGNGAFAILLQPSIELGLGDDVER